MSGDDSSLSLRAAARETVFRPFPLASPSGALYIERMFFLRRCINQSIHYLRLYRSLYSNSLPLHYHRAWRPEYTNRILPLELNGEPSSSTAQSHSPKMKTRPTRTDHPRYKQPQPPRRTNTLSRRGSYARGRSRKRRGGRRSLAPRTKGRRNMGCSFLPRRSWRRQNRSRGRKCLSFVTFFSLVRSTLFEG